MWNDEDNNPYSSFDRQNSNDPASQGMSSPPSQMNVQSKKRLTDALAAQVLTDRLLLPLMMKLHMKLQNMSHSGGN